jgi:hypothetical protein
LKVPIQILLLGFLIWIGWRQSFSAHFHRIFPNAGSAEPTPARAARFNSAAPAPPVLPAAPRNLTNLDPLKR